MTLTPSNRYRIIIILAVTSFTVAFHYGWIVRPSLDDGGFFHAIHGRLCYIPIILGAIWFGVRGGVGVALLITALTIPYALFGDHSHHGDVISEYTEMIFYMAIGLTAGILIELQRRERRRGETLSRELAREKHLSSLGQMAAGLTHEIKNPLGSIKGAVEILGDDYPPGSKKHELVGVLLTETDRLNRVVEDFLNFARPRPIARTPTQINTVLQNVASQIEIDSNKSNIHVIREFDEDLPVAALDGGSLHQVFLNIALNAVSAMPDGGRLWLRTSRDTLEGQQHVIVTFTDEGTGITPEDTERIFDPFFTRSEEGTGLGLSISHTIVQNHGGRITVTPNRGKGTTVSVILPVVEGK